MGDKILVQVVKPPRGNKGAKVTTHISLVGRRLIYLPRTDFLGISRRITDEKQRESLLKIADELRNGSNTEGFIVRTQATCASEEQLEREAQYLKSLYAQTLERAKNAPVGGVIYQDEELPIRVLRDSIGDDTSICVADETLYQKLLKMVSLRGEFLEDRLFMYTGERSLIKEYGIATLINQAMTPRVNLENGGYLVIDHTEAMTVVDVNTGSYVGTDNLEDTVFAVNLMASKEIARQVRLRNISGIVVVDFIHMADEEHRLAVNKTLEECLANDKAKCKILPMSEFCISQFTRKRVGTNFLHALLSPCPHCLGTGYAYSDFFVLARIRSNILDYFADGNKETLVTVSERIFDKIRKENTYKREVCNHWKNKSVYLAKNREFKDDYFTLQSADELPTSAILLQ